MSVPTVTKNHGRLGRGPSAQLLASEPQTAKRPSARLTVDRRMGV
jgi:hypothetical protein